MKNLKLSIILILIFAVTGLFFGQEVVESIVAIVNDDIITLSQVMNAHDSLYQMLRSRLQGEEFQQQYDRMKKELLDSMITELLLLQEAKRRGLNVAEQVRLTIDNIKEENGLNSDEELMLVMRQQGIDFETWKKQMEDNIMRQGVIMTEVDRNIVIEDSEVVNYYKTHPDEFTEPREYKLKAIYVSALQRDREEAEKLKQEISSKVAAGEDFASLASTYSEGPEKESQGDLGSFKEGELAKNLEEAVKNLNQGETAQWLEVQDGWYLLRLEEKKERRLKSFEEVKKEVEEKIFGERRQNKLEEFLEEIKEKSYIKILNPNPFDS